MLKENEGKSEGTPKNYPFDYHWESPMEIGLLNMTELYLRQATRVKLLTFEEEITLAKQVEKGIEARKKLISNGKLTKRKKHEIQKTINEGQEAFNHLIEANTRFVVNIAKNYFSKEEKLDFLDLIQEGNIGLVRSAKKYDPGKGFRFSTCSGFWIRQAIGKAIIYDGKTIRNPEWIHEERKKLYKTIDVETQKLGEEPSLKHLSKITKRKEKKLERLLVFDYEPLSLNKSIRRNDGNDENDNFLILEDFIEGGINNPEEEVLNNISRKEIKDKLTRALSSLPVRQRGMIESKFGICDGTPKTYEEVGKIYGISGQAVRETVNRSFEKLRDPKFGLKDYLEDK